MLSYPLSDDESLVPVLAAYAAGRMLMEDATLSYGLVGGGAGGQAAGHARPGVFLWQEAPAESGAHGLRRLFETFMDSCDWWRERVESRATKGEGREEAEKTMVILP